MPAKHQPDLIYLRYVPLWKVHIFTLVQLTCLVLLWVIKASAAAVVFPMMVINFTLYQLTETLKQVESDKCRLNVLSVSPGSGTCLYPKASRLLLYKERVELVG